jgi:hypothetical protein
VFKDKWFSRFARKQKISDETLKDAARDLENGVWDADFGGHLYKKRIARKGEGKSGAYRLIIVFKSDERTFFIYGFTKSARDDIEDDEKAAFKRLAKVLLNESDNQIEAHLKCGDLKEII